MALLLVLGVSAAGLSGPAVWILVAWIGVILPYKLTRERADRARQAADVSKRLKRHGRKIERAQAGLATKATIAQFAEIPTISELAEWQEIIERRSAVLFAKVSSLDQLSESLRAQRELTESLQHHNELLRLEVEQRVAEMQGDSHALAATLQSDLMSVKDELDRDVPARFRRMEQRAATDVAHLSALYHLLGPNDALPSFSSWALSPAAAVVVVETILDSDAELIVEAGSGSSTVVAALALAKQGHGRVIALEHDAAFAEKTRRELRRSGVEEFAEVVVAPLVEYVVHGDTYLWYALDSLTFDVPIDVLLVDGPPGTTGPLARYPALPLLAQHLAPAADVLLDDVDRDEEVEIAKRWSQEFGLSLSLDFADGELGKGRFQR